VGRGTDVRKAQKKSATPIKLKQGRNLRKRGGMQAVAKTIENAQRDKGEYKSILDQRRYKRRSPYGPRQDIDRGEVRGAGRGFGPLGRVGYDGALGSRAALIARRREIKIAKQNGEGAREQESTRKGQGEKDLVVGYGPLKKREGRKRRTKRLDVQGKGP